MTTKPTDAPPRPALEALAPTGGEPAKARRPTKEERALKLLAEARAEKAQKLAIARSTAVTKALRASDYELAQDEAEQLQMLLDELCPQVEHDPEVAGG
jgi:hypothetical protein